MATSRSGNAAQIHCRVEDRLCLITLDNPPVNALSVNQGFVQALLDHLRAGEANPAIGAFVLLGAGRNFCGGADIAEFGTPYRPGMADAPVLTAFMDTVTKPIVAALHGATMGGGFEIALACHHRLAARDTLIALPEVRLGILPAAGGTQRAARLLGVRRALDFVLTGETVDAIAALDLGLVDRIVDGDVDAAARAFARELIDRAGGVRRASELPVSLGEPAAAFFAAERDRVRQAWPGCPAPLALVDCIEAAATRPFVAGIALEARLFDRLVVSPEAAAMRHLFFSERAAAKSPPGARRLDRAAVIGSGSGACGIASVLAAAGLSVTLVTEDDAAAAGAAAELDRVAEQAVRRRGVRRSDADAQRARITVAQRLDRSGAGIAIIAVAEDLDATRAVVAAIERACGDQTVIAINTGNLDVDRIAAAAARPQRVLATHFFMPAPVMRLVEVAPGRETDPAVLASTTALIKRTGRFPVCVAPRPALVATRTLQAYLHEAACLLDEGILPARVDRLMREFGLPMGPFELMDFIGLDVGRRLRGPGGVAAFAGLRRTELLDRLIALGRLGRKSGAGIHRYADRAPPQPDADLEAWVRERAAGGDTTDGEIVERLLARLINECARTLDDGLARSPGDIDVIHAHGYGFPRRLGGPTFHADTVGLPRILATVHRYHAAYGSDWTPSPRLSALAAAGGRFNSPTKEST
ncbi:MAG: 3-hydroxyacyl-CoA dehydrogenase NAD-binding domain-containing protein [Lautropia sp.]